MKAVAARGAARLAAGAVARVVALASGVLKGSIIAAAGIMMACIVIQVVMRYVFGRAPSWTEEAAMLMFSWAILGGLALGVREGFHVRLTLLPDLLKPAPQRWLERLILLGILGFGIMLARGGYTYVAETVGQTSAAIAYPIEALHLAAPVCGVLVALHALAKLATSFLPDTPANPHEAR